METNGTVIAVLPLESGTSKAGKEWQKRNFVIETPGQYPRKVCLQLFGDKVGLCPAVGEVVKVDFEPESREWNGKWFTQLNAWGVERVKEAQAGEQTQPSAQPTAEAANDEFPF